MKPFVKSALFASLGVTCLALGSGAQQPPPVPTPAPAAPVIYGQSGTTVLQPGTGVYTGRLATTDGTTTLWMTAGHDHETMKLAKDLAAAKSDSEKDKIKDKLLDALNKAFDQRQKHQEKEIEALEKQVAKLKEMVSKRQEAKKEIIADRVKQLEREAKGLGW